MAGIPEPVRPVFLYAKSGILVVVVIDTRGRQLLVGFEPYFPWWFSLGTSELGLALVAPFGDTRGRHLSVWPLGGLGGYCLSVSSGLLEWASAAAMGQIKQGKVIYNLESLHNFETTKEFFFFKHFDIYKWVSKFWVGTSKLPILVCSNLP